MTLHDSHQLHPPSPLAASRQFALWARALTLGSAGLLVAGGYVHFCLYRHGYRFIPKIGIGFLLQFTSSALITAALLFARGSLRAAGHRFAVVQVARLGGIALAAGTLGALAIAHTDGGLFGFHETGLQPSPQTLITVIAEYDAAVLLAIAMACSRGAAKRGRAADVDASSDGGRLSDAA